MVEEILFDGPVEHATDHGEDTICARRQALV
jgi:hypothetical protein